MAELEGGKVSYTVNAPNPLCDGKIKVINTSTVAATIEITKEEGIECTIKKKGCEKAKLVNNGASCESELEKPQVTPEYELKLKWNGMEFGPDIWAA